MCLPCARCCGASSRSTACWPRWLTFGYALYDSYQIDGDAVAYMDIGDYLRAHQWAGIVNGYWHPMYPAFLSLGHALFHATPATELRAYYFVNFGIFLLGMAGGGLVHGCDITVRGPRFEVRVICWTATRCAISAWRCW